MSDRKLLEDAAKAAGIEVLSPSRWPIGQQQFGLWIQIGTHRTAVGWWNPLTDDGDALRLAVKLNLDVHFWPEHPEAWVEAMAQDELLGSDPYAATRRAIVRAAAAIGAAK
jgi:hypothetical protein